MSLGEHRRLLMVANSTMWSVGMHGGAATEGGGGTIGR